MSPLDSVLATAKTDADGVTAHIDAGWMQGRTAYGGISSAVALHAALMQHPGDAPLRCAQISFVGPVSGDCHVGTRLIRESKNSRFVVADVSSDAGFGTSGLFTFSRGRESHVDIDRIVAPVTPDPETLAIWPQHPSRPVFTKHFDMRAADGSGGLPLGSDSGELLTWVRYLDTPTCHPVVALLALGDALPPAAISMFRQFGPLSSMNWTINFLVDELVTDDGWWLLSARTGFARNGFSVQDMTIWNRQGQAVAIGSQGIGIYV